MSVLPKLILSKRALEIAGLLGIVIFVLIKDLIFVPATGITKHGVNMVTLLAIDEGTIPTLILGQEWISRTEASYARRLAGILIASASYAAPYVYIAIVLEKAPNAIEPVAAFVLLTAVIIFARRLFGRQRNPGT